MTEQRRRTRRRRKEPAGGQGCLCNQCLFGLVWGSSGSSDFTSCSSQHYLFLPCLGSVSHSPDTQPAPSHSLHHPTQAPWFILCHPSGWKELQGQVSSPCKLDLLFQPENRHFPFIPLSTREHCKEPQHSASLQATQSQVCTQEPSSPCSDFVIRKALVNPPDLSLFRPGRLMLSLGPCLQLLLIPRGIWLLFLLAWTHCYLSEICNFMEPSPPNEGH